MYRHLSNNYDTPYEQAHVGERPFDPGVVNSNNYDANGLLRACALPQSYRYSHIAKLALHFYAHIGAGLKVIPTHMSKLMWVKDLSTLAS